jgi:hypothetical protein
MIPRHHAEKFWCNQPLPELLLPFSYSHLLLRLTLDRFPVAGVGVGGPSPNILDAVLAPKRLDAVLAPSELGEPKDAFLPTLSPPPTAL